MSVDQTCILWRPCRTVRMLLFIATILAAISIEISRAQTGLAAGSDFSDGTTNGWTNGTGSENVRVELGGPGGATDYYLHLESNPTAQGSGFKPVAFNRSAHWTGDFIKAGVTHLDLYARNITRINPTILRVALSDSDKPGDNWWVSRDGYNMPDDGNWHPVSLQIDDSVLAQVAGDDDLATVMSNVRHFRLLINRSLNFRGEIQHHTVGFDNLQLRLRSDSERPVFADDFEVASVE